MIDRYVYIKNCGDVLKGFNNFRGPESEKNEKILFKIYCNHDLHITLKYVRKIVIEVTFNLVD